MLHKAEMCVVKNNGSSNICVGLLFYHVNVNLKKITAGNSLICSFRSNQMSDCERFAQITQDKLATVKELLRLLRGNEQPWAILSGRSEEMSEWAIRSKKFWLKNLKSCFSMIYKRFKKKLLKKLANCSFSFISSFLVSDVSESEEMSDQEQIAQVAHQK